jgi:hypothetical protein
MTYLFKLVRRLAISRDSAMLPILALLAACAGEATAPEGTGGRADINPASIRVLPEAATLAVGATRAFNGTAYRRDGSVVPLGLVWSATGGTLDPDGNFTADSIGGMYHVIAANTAGTVADTAEVTVVPPPTPVDTVPPPPAAARVILRPVRVTVIAGKRQRYRAFGRTSSGDSVTVGVTYSATGGTITQRGLYTAGKTAGTYKIIANAGAISDTSLVTLLAAPNSTPVTQPTPTTPSPFPTPTPVPPPGQTGRVGVPFGVSGVLTAGVGAAPFTMSLDGYNAGSVLARLADARAANVGVLMNMTGGDHNNYITNGAFDLGKWKAKVDTYGTPAIKSAIATAVATGTIVGNSVMDEPQNTTPGKSWGGVMTKELVDQMCLYVKSMFPTLPVGVVHDHRVFEPEKNYQHCDFILSQYRLSKGDIQSFRDGGLAFAKRSGIAIAFSLNVLHGGVPGTTCPKWGADPRGQLCPMSPEQVRSWGMTLGSAGCALNMWRYEPGFFDDPDIQAALRAVADSLAKLPRRDCLRP